MSRRVPLSNLPNAANSPYRAAAPGTKRARSHADGQRELAYAQPPPAKKQMLEADAQDGLRHAQFRKAGYNNPPTILQKKLEAAAREGTRQTSVKVPERPAKTGPDNLESIRQWQRHYKKVFPQVVFYYESIPDDVRAKISRQVQSLGSREEVFFSKTVTHVVTTRSIPPESTSSSSGSGRSPDKGRSNGVGNTINPLLLETQQVGRKFTFEAPMPKRGQTASQTLAPSDILYKAREMGMKIWSLEKLNRMLSTMFNNETGEAPVLTQHSRTVSTASTRAGRGEADLTSLLQKEKQYGRATQEWASDMAPFRGRYVYIHDMNEETRPVMVRDYPNPEKKELGKWPQLRVNGPGRCPFLNDPVSRDQTERAAAGEQAPRTRAAAAALQATRQDTPLEAGERRVLAENSNLARRSRSVSIQPADDHVKPLDPPKSIPIKRGSTDTLPMFGSAQASLRYHPRFAGGEPVASGVQPSNITSAIRSQMISSTAAAPGAKTGGTKELNRLKRQVLERNAAPSANSMTTSHMNEIRAAINNDRTTTSKASKRKGQDLAHIREEEDAQSEEEVPPRRAPVTRKKKAVEKELKPGYCENCRVKFNDFDEHVISKQHRKFATTADNWIQLDDLLSQLIRPLKDDE